ncbi:hypothetical protein IWX90DRAFT_310712 [Phyllosticta citrichinensis]|uniref:Uncharacterized protein n=1 Tax=Phyllosticta citrichinensis TaxID=1130410 RepID=A0ABR1XLT3_9PEZI
MAQPAGHVCHSETWTAKQDDVPSTVYAILPALIQSRIPRLRSLRRTVSNFRNSTTAQPKEPSSALPYTCGPDASASQTPPPRYTSRPSSATTRRPSGLSDSDSVQTLSDDALIDERPSSSSSATPLPVYRPLEMQSGINWKYAKQGLSLLTTALQEYSTLGTPDHSAPSFSRQLYLHALTYLLKGLPSDLSADEKLSIETALPPDTVKVVHVDAASGQLVRSDGHHAAMHSRTQPPEPSWLHRLLASSIIQLFLFLHLLLPYIKLFLSQAYQYEREHRISERLFASSIQTVDELGRRSIRVTNAICQMNDGKVGQAINDLTLWSLRAVTGGIHEGVSEGFLIIGAREDVRVAQTGKA